MENEKRFRLQPKSHVNLDITDSLYYQTRHFSGVEAYGEARKLARKYNVDTDDFEIVPRQ
ncbi:MAG TPA: hypothetical protein VJI12_03405 [archaeon]|nr:hypothetical protein [archaeon]